MHDLDPSRVRTGARWRCSGFARRVALVPALLAAALLVGTVRGQTAGEASALPSTSTLSGSLDPGLFAGSASLVSISGSPTWPFDVADIDGDGDLDVVAPRSLTTGDSIVWWPNLGGSAGFGAPLTAATIADEPARLHAADIDGDGDADVVFLLRSADTLGWIENLDGAGSFGPVRLIALVEGPWDSLVLDLDGDDDLDVALTSLSTRQVLWFPNSDGLGHFGLEQQVTGDVSVPSLDAADFDADGDLDLLAAGGDETHALSWYRNLDGAGHFGPVIPIGSNFVNAFTVRAGDLDGDGVADAVSLRDSVRWFRNVGGQGSFNFGTQLGGSYESSSQLALDDPDGDGDLDILVARRTELPLGGLYWYENVGTNAFQPQHKLWDKAWTGDVRFADVDADGDDDVLTSGWALAVSHVYWAPSLLGSAEWPFLGDGLQGSGGMPLLQGDGPLSGGSTVTLSLSKAAASSTATLVMGLSALELPFKGGVLVPSPDLPLVSLPVDGAGGLSLVGTWPAGVPDGISLWLQQWVSDPTGPAGYAASNAIRGTTVP